MEEEFFVYRRLPPHKNVVSMIDSWDDDNKGRSYLVMDYMSGGTLDSLIRKAWSNSTTTTITTTTSEESSSSNTTTNNNNVRGLPLSQIRTLFRKALIGLNHLHKNGVYHRDIKPDNLMLTPDLNVCVSDFGTATLEASTRGIGAPGFQPPEVILTGTAPDSAKIDTWAMGVTLHMMATGMHPFGTQAASLYQLIERIGNRPYEPPEGLPEQLCDLLCKALTRDPQERLTVDAMLEHPWMTQGMNEDEDENNMAEFVLPDLLTTVFTDANVAHLQTEFTYIEQSDGNVHMEEVLDVEIEGDSIRLKKKKKMMRKKSCCDCCCCCCIIA